MPRKPKQTDDLVPIADVIAGKSTRKKSKAETKLDQKVARQRATKQANAEMQAKVAQEAIELNTAPGRPTDYTPELAAQFCGLIASGLSVRKACASDPDMPSPSTIFMWLFKHPEFTEQYTRAQEARTEAYAEDIIDIADDATNDYIEVEREDGSTYETYNAEHVQRSKLRIDARIWHAGKIKPKKYGTPDPFGGSPVLVQPLIYIPQEKSYNDIVNNAQKSGKDEAIDGEVVS